VSLLGCFVSSEEAIFVACIHMCASIAETVLCQVKDHMAMTFGTPCEIMEKGAPEELVTEGYVHDIGLLETLPLHARGMRHRSALYILLGHDHSQERVLNLSDPTNPVNSEYLVCDTLRTMQALRSLPC